MKKKFCLFLFIIAAFYACNIAFSNSYYWPYYEGRHPENEDLRKAKINTAIALQQIAENGIVLHIEFRNELEIKTKD